MWKTVFFVPILLFMETSLASLDLAKKNNCTVCHQVEKKVIGPAYQDIYKKYKDQKNALEVLEKSVTQGSSGKWGASPMPAQDKVDKKELASILKWILAGAK